MGTHLIERFTPRIIVDVVCSPSSGNSFVGFGFVTDSAPMQQALRDLSTAKKEGLLSDEQYEKQHAALLAGEQRWGSSPTPDRLACVESKLDQLTESSRLLPPPARAS